MAIADPTEVNPYFLELCRRRLLPFVKHTFMGDYQIFDETKLVAAALERFETAVVEHRSPRLLIIEPPRVGKSELATKNYPAWLLGRHPDWYIGIVAYGDDLAWEFSGDARTIVQSEEYQQIFGTGRSDGADPTETVEIDPKTQSVKHWKIRGHRGGLRGAGINGSLTGKGFQVVALDDPTKGRDEADSIDYREKQWRQFKGTFYPRVEPGGGIILTGTQWHEDDIIGRILKENHERADEPLADHWEVLHIPAKAVPGRADLLGRKPGEWMAGRRTIEEWRKLEANLPAREWSAQYMGMPTPEGGAIFRPYEDFWFADPPEDDSGEYRGPRYGFTDTSHAKNRTSDFSAVGVFQIEPHHTLGVLDLFQGRVQYPELKNVAHRMYMRWALNGLIIEDYSAGRALAQEFMRDRTMRIGRYRPDRDKYARAHAASGEIRSVKEEANPLNEQQRWRIRLPKENRFPSGLPVQVFLDELAHFQPGAVIHDDMVDVFTMAVILIGVRDYPGRRVVRKMDFAFGGV